jgi:5-(carboxyamino)imidazole ribonucleotide synthase
MSASIVPVLPGNAIGIAGGGQLGMMFARSAKQMGYDVVVLTLSSDDPACSYAKESIIANYDDKKAYHELAKKVKVITYEFEGVSAEILTEINEITPVFPAPNFLYHTQHRKREKVFLENLSLPVAKNYLCRNRSDLGDALKHVGVPSVLKTTTDGYDGKGQFKFTSNHDALTLAESAWDNFHCKECIVEQWVNLKTEISVVVARDRYSHISLYGPFENTHTNHILDYTICPSALSEQVKREALSYAEKIATSSNVVGVFCVEFFVDQNDKVFINEIAPRPHNSGHLTIEAFECSQFEQQVRTVCGLPVGSSRQLSLSAMINILGDSWTNGEPDWGKMLKNGNVHLHLYGKKIPKKGRKMGHVTVLSNNSEQLLETVAIIRKQLLK